MKLAIQETEVLVKKTSEQVKAPTNLTKEEGKTSVKLTKDAIEHLELRSGNEYMPYFLLNPEDKKNNVFAQLFIAKHCRNAYAGLFIKLITAKRTNLNEKEKIWVQNFRSKGYACAVITSINNFDRCIEAYKHTVGVSGYNFFHATYERSHS